jgi:hypothetical protein
MMNKLLSRKKRNCSDCGAVPGALHVAGCDVERCPNCGGQALSCGCDYEATDERLPWTGRWPGDDECEEFGWYSKPNPNGVGYVPCAKSDPSAGYDLNRLYTDAKWDKAKKRFVKK